LKIGLMLSLSNDTAVPPPYRQIRADALAAEAAGLDSIWIYDHLIFAFPGKTPAGIWEGFTIMTGLAEATSTIELGALVFCTSFRNPAVLAKMAVTLDEISGGRIVLGLGAGWHEPEYQAFGIPFDHLASRFEEALKIIVPLLRKGEVDFTGTYSSAPNSTMLPPASRQIPILIASSKERMLKLTAEYADQWNTAWVGEVSSIEDRRAAMDKSAESVGRDPKTLMHTVGVNISFTELGGSKSEETDPAKTIMGTVEEVAAGLRRYEAAGVGHIIASLDAVNADSIRLLARAREVSRSTT